MKIAITGHRPNKLWNDYTLTSPQMLLIKHKLQELIDQYKPTQMITGMALGIDTLWAKLAIENNIPFIAAIPCKKQEYPWPKIHQFIYSDLLANPLCTKHLVSNERYTAYCMQRRNEWMVDNCDLLIAVWDGSSGGTANCVGYANKVKKQLIILNPRVEITYET